MLHFRPQLFDSSTLDHIKSFKTERPVNSAAISPICDHVRPTALLSQPRLDYVCEWVGLWVTYLTCVCFSFSQCVQVVMGGGQEAMEVTTTSTRIGKFEARWALGCISLSIIKLFLKALSHFKAGILMISNVGVETSDIAEKKKNPDVPYCK